MDSIEHLESRPEKRSFRLQGPLSQRNASSLEKGEVTLKSLLPHSEPAIDDLPTDLGKPSSPDVLSSSQGFVSSRLQFLRFSLHVAGYWRPLLEFLLWIIRIVC